MSDEEEQNNEHQELLEEFINAYKEEKCLWQTNLKAYSDRDKRNAAYKRLLEVYKSIDSKATRATVVKKINNLRTTYKKALNKVKKSEKSGAGTDEIYVPKLWYFKLFLFLEEQETPRDSRSNLSEDESDTEEHLDEQINELNQSDNTNNPDEIEDNIAPPRTSRRKVTKKKTDLTEEVLMSVNEHFKRPKINEDRFDFYSKNLAIKLRELPQEQRMFAEKLINDTLFLAETGRLTIYHSLKSKEPTQKQAQDQENHHFNPYELPLPSPSTSQTLPYNTLSTRRNNNSESSTSTQESDGSIMSNFDYDNLLFS